MSEAARKRSASATRTSSMHSWPPSATCAFLQEEIMSCTASSSPPLPPSVVLLDCCAAAAAGTASSAVLHTMAKSDSRSTSRRSTSQGASLPANVENAGRAPSAGVSRSSVSCSSACTCRAPSSSRFRPACAIWRCEDECDMAVAAIASTAAGMVPPRELMISSISLGPASVEKASMERSASWRSGPAISACTAATCLAAGSRTRLSSAGGSAHLQAPAASAGARGSSVAAAAGSTAGGGGGGAPPSRGAYRRSLRRDHTSER